MVRAWRALPSFDGRSSLGTWLHRIATNACLDALGDRGRRVRSFDERPVGTVDDALDSLPAAAWIEPLPEARVVPDHATPAETALARERVRLAFVTALQHLPPKQRAALLLTEVVGLSAAETADALDLSIASVNSALQRARATLAGKPTLGLDDAPTLEEQERALVDRWVVAFERYDVEALTSLLHDDAILSMPPYTLWLRGHASIAGWLLGRGVGCRGSRLLRTRASGTPAFGQYRASSDGGHRAWSLMVLEPSGGRVARATHFLDVERMFPAFGLPLVLGE